MGDDREPPHRALNKLHAVRHLLHASIRLQYAEEDPLIIHSTVMSCWKIINDYGRRTGNSRITDIEVLLKPDKKDAFWNSLFEIYNYFKHADRDAFENLIVPDIVTANELGILLNIARGQQIGMTISQHCNSFIAYIRLFYPSPTKFIAWPSFTELIYAREQFASYSRSQMLRLSRDAAEASEAFRDEREADLIDIRKAGAKIRRELP